MIAMYRLRAAVGVLLLFGSGLFVGRYLLPAGEFECPPSCAISANEHGQRQLLFPVFWQAWDELHTNFIGQLNDNNLLYGAVKGMIQAAEDPYTIFADPNDTKQFEEALSGSFSGIGVEIGMRNGLITIIAPLEGSPAEKAGIKAGDLVVAVDGQPLTPDMALDDIVQKIRGQQGTAVTLSVIHSDSRQAEDITITRDTIEIESVRHTIINNIAHISITHFSEDTTPRVIAAVQKIKQANVEGIILDMRGNPGGFLQGAVEIASQFLPTDTLVVTEQGKRSKEYRSKGPHPLSDLPVVVLIDGGSASASEIVAGALRDQRQVPVIGEKSFGKGSVQEFIHLDDGSSLRVTIAKWFTPSGQSINDEGIPPTIEVEDNADTEADEQLERAQEELKQLLK